MADAQMVPLAILQSFNVLKDLTTYFLSGARSPVVGRFILEGAEEPFATAVLYLLHLVVITRHDRRLRYAVFIREITTLCILT